MPLVAVAPILPTAQSLLLIALLLLGSALTAAASLLRPAALRTALRVIWRQKWSLLVIASVLLAGRLLVQRGSGAPRLRLPHTEPVAASWPMFRGNLSRTGAVADEPGPRSGTIHWQAAPTEAFYASPAVAGDYIYCVASRGDSGRIDCRRADTGELVWSAAPPGYAATISSPVVAGDFLVVGEGLHRTQRGRVVCIDLRPEQAGQILWTVTTNSHVECTPVIAGQHVYVNAGDDGIYCLALQRQSNAAQQVVWHVAGQPYPDAETSLAVADGRVYVGLGHGGSAVAVLDALTGNELARIALPYPVFGPPAIAADKLYVGLGRGDFLNFTADRAGQVACIDRERLTIDWTFSTPSTVLGAVVAADDELYFGCTDGSVYALDRDGQQLGEWKSGAPITASLSCTSRHIYAVNYFGQLTALDRRSLTPVWNVALGAPSNYISSPVIARGRVFVGTPGDGLLCVGEPPPAEPASLWPGTYGGPGAGGCLDDSALPDHSELVWQWPASSDRKAPRIEAPVAVTERWLAVPLASAEQPGIACLTPATRNRAARLAWRIATDHPVRRSPALRGDQVFFVDTSEVEDQQTLGGGTLVCASIAQQRLVWQYAIRPQASGVMLVTEREVFVQDAPNTMSALDAHGAKLWDLKTGRLTSSPWVDEARVVVAATAPPQLMVCDRSTGRLLWRAPLSERPTTAPVVERQRIWLGTATGLRIFDLVNGREHRTALGPQAKVSEPLWLDRQGRCVAIADRQLLRVGEADAAELYTFASPHNHSAGHSFAAAANGLLIVDGASLALWRTGAATPQPWSSLAELGAVTSPPVLYDGCVYLGIEGLGLVTLGTRGHSHESPR